VSIGRLLGGAAMGRKIAENLVHIEHGSQAGRARLATHPRQNFVEQQRDEEHALRIRKVRNRNDRHAWLALGRAQQTSDVERLATRPACRRWRRQQGVDRDGQIRALFLGKKCFELDHANALERRRLNLTDDARQIERLAGRPSLRKNLRQEHVLTAAQRIGLDADQPEQPRHGALDFARKQLRVFEHGRVRRLERAEQRQLDAGGAARRVDGEVAGVTKAGNSVGILAPFSQTGDVLGGHLFGVRSRGQPLPSRFFDVDPRREIFSLGARKAEQQIRDVTLRVDHDRRYAVDGRLFEQADAQTGLAAAGHAHAQRVRRQMSRVVQHELRAPLALR
jgi:hypothetical protein